MNVLILCAVFAVALALGGYLGVRFSNASHQLNADISRFLLVPDGHHRMDAMGLIADSDEFDRDRWRWGR